MGLEAREEDPLPAYARGTATIATAGSSRTNTTTSFGAKADEAATIAAISIAKLWREEARPCGGDGGSAGIDPLLHLLASSPFALRLPSR